MMRPTLCRPRRRYCYIRWSHHRAVAIVVAAAAAVATVAVITVVVAVYIIFTSIALIAIIAVLLTLISLIIALAAVFQQHTAPASLLLRGLPLVSQVPALATVAALIAPKPTLTIAAAAAAAALLFVACLCSLGHRLALMHCRYRHHGSRMTCLPSPTGSQSRHPHQHPCRR